ncbi:MAG: acyl-[acyl-carrier-protein]--UDP-N-acetylglucosamine O-acyltransferase [Phycisphaerae bacterium]|nr:acyl-[acyl-carrier-protein]--UDP-N-acetylglucosamine O-acyltransferase [Phycisphaerae bacterium]
MSEVEVLCEIAPSARVAAEAEVGPYCVVGPEVTIGPGTVLTQRVTVVGRTTLGSGNVVAEGCVLGTIPQDLKYAGGPTLLVIGHRNRFGPRVTAHIGTEVGGGVTRIGDDNVLRDGCHVAHDCYIDDRATLGHHVLLAGHVLVETGAVIEHGAGAHHFVTIGRYARVAPRTPIRRDVPPFTEFYSDDPEQVPPAVRGVHYAGVRAAALAAPEESELLRVLGELFDDESALQTKIEQLEKMGVEGAAAELCGFVHRSLQGIYGRYRECFRGQAPPEAAQYLTPEQHSAIRRPVP